MPREVAEWIGRTPDSQPPKSVRLRVFAAYDGRCYLTGQKIGVGDIWELEHVKPLWGGGENRESNLAPALKAAHAQKTASEARARSKADRIRLKHIGAWPASRAKIRSRGFSPTRPQTEERE
jgi:5-methylcytosine-specific restriction endonuclease McrA